jgi:hypothetical protein
MQDDTNFGQRMRYKIELWVKSQAAGVVCFKQSPNLHGYDLNLVMTYIPSCFVKGQSYAI